MPHHILWLEAPGCPAADMCDSGFASLPALSNMCCLLPGVKKAAHQLRNSASKAARGRARRASNVKHYSKVCQQAALTLLRYRLVSSVPITWAGLRCVMGCPGLPHIVSHMGRRLSACHWAASGMHPAPQACKAHLQWITERAMHDLSTAWQESRQAVGRPVWAVAVQPAHSMPLVGRKASEHDSHPPGELKAAQQAAAISKQGRPLPRQLVGCVSLMCQVLPNVRESP